jgi:hypothetical protein
MEFKVEAASHLRRKFLTAIMPSMIEQLGLTNSKKAVVVKVDSDCADHMGCTINFDAFDAYLIVIKPASLKSIGLTLAHEMVHVKQMAKGTLKPRGGGVNIWAGKKYGKKTKYLDMPWELDAFARQEIILRRAIEG